MELISGTLLERGKYRIISTLGRGGYGITYLAEQVLARRKVCIKEFFPNGYYKRDEGANTISILSQSHVEIMSRFKEKFIKEAQTIANLHHPNIIQILDVFEANNTAYYVMEYVEGSSLNDLVKQRGALAEADAVRYIRMIASALDYIHEQKINHLDIKPSNIMVSAKDDKAVLIDFGLSKHYDEVGDQTSSTPVGISHGYAPMEQYNVGGVNSFSPSTDIYSLGATLYALVTGKQPPVASVVGEFGIGAIPSHLSSGVVIAIESSMRYWRKERPQSIVAFMALLEGEKRGEVRVEEDGAVNTSTISDVDHDAEQTIIEDSITHETITPKKPLDNKLKSKSGRWRLWSLLMLVVIGIVCAVVMNVGDDSPDADQDVTPSGVVQPKSELSILSNNIMNFDHNRDQGTINYSLTNSADVPNVTSNNSWVTITSVSKSGTITFDVAANSSEESRSATIKVEYNGQHFNVTITQRGKPIQTYEVGDYYNENGKKGIVFEVWDGGRHGKIVSLYVTAAQWDSRAKDEDGQWIDVPMTYADSDSDGKANTDKLMSRNDSQYFLAAKWCRDMGISWYLPAKNELKAIYNNLDKINNSLTKVGATTLFNSYWSSTEGNELCAWLVAMSDGYTDYYNKNFNFYVRAVSTF